MTFTTSNTEIDTKEFLDTVSKNVVYWRKQRGFSQLQLAVAMGYESSSYIGRMELRKNGQHFNIEQLFKITKILDIHMDDLCIIKDDFSS